MKFNFTSSEKNGMIALLVIIVMLQVSIFIVKRQLNSRNTIVLSDQEHETFQKYLDSIAIQYEAKVLPVSDYADLKLFEFDPNKIDQNGLIELGFRKNVAQTLINYREKVRPYQSSQELFNVYGIDSLLLVRLLPYINIELPEIEREKVSHFSTPVTKLDSLFEFNPNSISYQELLKLGFSEKLANTFINYRKAIGTFESKDQIRNVYGMSNEFFQKLSPHVYLPDTNNKAAQIVIEINSATANDFSKLAGIGSVLSKRIVNYRNYLGGFYSIEQLNNVYGLSDSIFINIKKSLKVDVTFIKKLNVNFLGVAELEKLPNCDKALATKIIEYRSQNGTLTTLDQLNEVVGEKEFEVLKYYLKVN